MKKLLIVSLALLCGFFTVSAKKTWKKGTAEWNKVQIQSNLTYDHAFNTVLELISNDFEMDMINKDGGYIRSAWSYMKNAKGKTIKDQRVRITIKFNHDHSQVQVKTEVQKQKGEDEWIDGEDSVVSQRIREDLRGSVGI